MSLIAYIYIMAVLKSQIKGLNIGRREMVATEKLDRTELKDSFLNHDTDLKYNYYISLKIKRLFF